MRRLCTHCKDTGKVQGEAAPAAHPADTLEIAGETITAPSFDADSFDRAVIVMM